MAGKSSLDITDGPKPYVLVCDDSAFDCALLRTILERDGIRVQVVNSPEEAFESLRKSTFDLLLLDVEMMGDATSIDLTRQLRQAQSEKAYTPIVLLTAHHDNSLRLNGLKAGATDFLTKPFDPLELTARIRNHIGAKRLHDRLTVINMLLQQERAKVFEAQLNLLPKKMPQIPALLFAAGYLPSQTASGDFYDVIVRPDDNILLAVADVSGHGISAAMNMSTLRSVLHTKAADGLSPSAILVELNHILSHGLDEFSFVTFYLAEYNPSTRLLRQVSAGHHPALLHDLSSNEIKELPLNGGYPLGIDKELELEETEVVLEQGQRLLIYTDGLVEQTSPDGKFFDLEGVTKSLLEDRDSVGELVIRNLLARLDSHAGNRQRNDDVTALMMEVK